MTRFTKCLYLNQLGVSLGNSTNESNRGNMFDSLTPCVSDSLDGFQDLLKLGDQYFS